MPTILENLRFLKCHLVNFSKTQIRLLSTFLVKTASIKQFSNFQEAIILELGVPVTQETLIPVFSLLLDLSYLKILTKEYLYTRNQQLPVLLNANT